MALKGMMKDSLFALITNVVQVCSDRLELGHLLQKAMYLSVWMSVSTELNKETVYKYTLL